MKKILFFIIILCSCKSQKELVGTYLSSSEHILTKIVLNEDQTFSFKRNEGLADYNSSGTWELKKKKSIVLESFPKTTSVNGLVKESIDKSLEDTLLLKLKSHNNIPLKNILVLVNHKDYYKTNMDGEVRILTTMNNFYTSFESGYQFYYEAVNKDSNRFEIILETKVSSLIHLLNYSFKVKNQKLIDSSGKKYSKSFP